MPRPLVTHTLGTASSVPTCNIMQQSIVDVIERTNEVGNLLFFDWNKCDVMTLWRSFGERMVQAALASTCVSAELYSMSSWLRSRDCSFCFVSFPLFGQVVQAERIRNEESEIKERKRKKKCTAHLFCHSLFLYSLLLPIFNIKLDSPGSTLLLPPPSLFFLLLWEWEGGMMRCDALPPLSPSSLSSPFSLSRSQVAPLECNNNNNSH